VKEAQGQLRLCNIRPEIHKVFEITKLTEVFQIHDGLAAAMASLA
jgi:anti-anti-sigma regulatory factor